MRLVDTATLALYLGVTTRTVARRVNAGTLTPLGQWGKGGRGRPGWFFDLDAVRDTLAKDRGVSHIGT